jgi:hypothetical protein
MGDAGTTVKIILVENQNGTIRNRIITRSTSIGSGGAGSFKWTIPKNLPSGKYYKIKVISKTADAAIRDVSDRKFTITK